MLTRRQYVRTTGLPPDARPQQACRDPTIDLRELLHLDQAVTVMPDRHTDADLFTGEPDLYAIAGDRPDWVIPIDAEW